jgi:hypothetical protein
MAATLAYNRGKARPAQLPSDAGSGGAYAPVQGLSGPDAAPGYGQVADDRECATLPRDRKVLLNRGDLGIGDDSVTSWHAESHELPKCLFRLKLSSRVIAAPVRHRSLRGVAVLGSKPTSWSRRDTVPTDRVRGSGGD